MPQPSVLPTKPIRTIPPVPPPTIPTVKPPTIPTIPPPTIPTIPPPTLPTIKPPTRTPTVPPTRTASGSIQPRHLAFTEVASLPGGHSIWRLDYGLQYTGGMVGTTEDTEFQILNPGGDGSIDSAGAFTGCLNGRTGGFAFESEGVQNPDGSFEMSFVITPGTGHGGLSGVSGRFKVVATRAHCSPADTPETCTTLVSYTLAYSLPS